MTPASGDGRDPELEALLSSFDGSEPAGGAGSAAAADVPLDELVALFGTGSASDPTVPLAEPEQASAVASAVRDAVVPAVVADVPVETGIDWLGAPVFGGDDGDVTAPIERPAGSVSPSPQPGGGSVPPNEDRRRAAVSRLDDTGLDDTGLDSAGLDGTGLDGTALDDTAVDDPGLGDPGLDSTGLDSTGLDSTGPDSAAREAAETARLREIAIPVGHVGVVAVDQETGEMLAPFREEELPTGKAFFGRTTIVITDDEGPDIGYLDDELTAPEIDVEAEPEVPELDPNTIYIGAKDEGFAAADRLPRRTARGGAIDPKLRERRSAVRREERSRRLIVASAVAALVVLLLIAVGVVASPMFGVTDIRVNGAVYTDATALDAIITDLQGDPVLLVDTGEIEAALLAVPWVERVRVDSRFPHTVVIDIRERRALATFRGSDGKWRVIDVQGRVLDVLDGQPVAYMPITGNHPDTARGQFAGAPYVSAATLVQVLPAEVRALTASVGLDAVTGTLTMELTGGVAVRLGSADDLDDKLARLLSQVRGGLAGVVALDVSTAQIGVVRG